MIFLNLFADFSWHVGLGLLLFIIGHVIRDGFPSFGPGETTLARTVGGLACAAGGSMISFSIWGALAGLCVGIGFWVDHDHAEGQQARNLSDAFYLAISGISSLIPLALMLLVWHWPNFYNLLVLAFGLAKIPIWFGCWAVVPQGPILQPTRVAAGLFGLTVGIAVWLLL